MIFLCRRRRNPITNLRKRQIHSYARDISSDIISVTFGDTISRTISGNIGGRLNYSFSTSPALNVKQGTITAC